jgi:hypothetical protein
MTFSLATGGQPVAIAVTVPNEAATTLVPAKAGMGSLLPAVASGRIVAGIRS